MYTKVEISYFFKFSKIFLYCQSFKSSLNLKRHDPRIEEGLFLSLSFAFSFSNKSLSTNLIFSLKSPSIPLSETNTFSKSKSIPAWIAPAKEELITAVGPPDWPIKQFIYPPLNFYPYI